MLPLPLSKPLPNRVDHGFAGDFYVGLTSKRRHTYVLANLAAGSDLAATVLLSPAEAVLITGVYITPDGSVAGVDASNTSVWTVANGATTIIAKTFTDEVVFPADNAQESLGTLAVPVIAAGGRVELTVTNGAAADLPAVLVTIEYVPLAGIITGWSAILSDGGSIANADAAGGIVTLAPSDATAGDNDEAYLFRTLETFLFADGKELECACRIQFTEANTDDANVILGLVSGVAANALQDDGAGPPDSYSGAVFFKVDGETVWNFETSIGSTQTTTALANTAGGAAYHTFTIRVVPLTATTFHVIPYIDGEWALDATGAPVRHTLTLGSPTEMSWLAGIKNGGANAESLLIDLATCRQER